MAIRITQGNTTEVLHFLLVSSADHITPVTGATPTVTLSKNGGAFVAAQGAVVEAGSGWYHLQPHAFDADTLGVLALHATAGGADPFDRTYEVVAAEAAGSDSEYPVTALDLIRRALQTLRVLGAGETPDADDANDAFQVLNEYIDWLGTQRLSIPCVRRLSFSLVANTGDYTIGPGGTFNTPLPTDIEGAGIQYPVAGGTPFEVPIEVYTERMWRLVTIKALTSTYPLGIRFERRAPLGTITVYPKPTASATLVLYVPQALTQFASLTTRYILLPGYPRMLRYNLAAELQALFGKSLLPRDQVKAEESLGDIKRRNLTVEELSVDPALVVGHGGRRSNIYTGEA